MNIRDALYESKVLSDEDMELEDRINSLEDTDEEDLEEELITEEQYVEIPVEPEMFVENLLKEEVPIIRKPGSVEYDSNEGRLKRVKHFRKLANLDDSEPITESLVESKDWAVKQTACVFNRPSARIKAELLNQEYTGLEEYED